MTTRAGGELRLRGAHVLFAMLMFFGGVIAVNVAFAILAVRSFPGEDVRRSYLQGLQYNEALAARRAQEAIGWRVQAALLHSGDAAALQVIVHDSKGAPLERVQVSGELRWPADGRLDRQLRFQDVGAGRYVATVATLHEGRWRLRARAEDEAGAARDFEAELTWPPSR